MTDRPIIFSGPMIRAWLDGSKQMTRRLAWGKPLSPIDEAYAEELDVKGWKMSGADDTGGCVGWPPTIWQRVKVGDHLWCREKSFGGGWSPSGDYDWFSVCYPADEKCMVLRVPQSGVHAPYKLERKIIPSIHMPRWASRLTLVVTATRIERLQAINEADAIAEGIQRIDEKTWGIPGEGQPQSFNGGPVSAFSALWMSLHGLGSWDKNPEVVAITATAHSMNIDLRGGRAHSICHLRK